MTAILLANQCPAVQVPSVAVYRNSGFDTSALVAPNIPGKTDWRMQANQIGAVSDQIARYGAGIFGVPDGPARPLLSAPAAGLGLLVQPGHAMIGGPVEIPAVMTVPVPDNSGPIWIWLRQLGSVLVPIAGSLVPPTGECCLIGNCTTFNGNIIAIDYSGVMLLRGGIGFRQTADAGAPADTPPSNVVFLASTPGGSYWWDGTAYKQAVPASVVATVITSSSDSSDRLDAMERKFRSLVFAMGCLFGEDVLTTEELAGEFDAGAGER